MLRRGLFVPPFDFAGMQNVTVLPRGIFAKRVYYEVLVETCRAFILPQLLYLSVSHPKET